MKNPEEIKKLLIKQIESGKMEGKYYLYDKELIIL